MAVIRIEAAGGQLAAFRDALRRNGVRCRNQQMRGECFSAETAAGAYRMLEALASRYQVRLTVKERHGLRYFFAPYRMRLGFVFGALCGIWFLWWCNARIRSIEITGNQRVPEAEIVRLDKVEE